MNRSVKHASRKASLHRRRGRRPPDPATRINCPTRHLRRLVGLAGGWGCARAVLGALPWTQEPFSGLDWQLGMPTRRRISLTSGPLPVQPEPAAGSDAGHRGPAQAPQGSPTRTFSADSSSAPRCSHLPIRRTSASRGSSAHDVVARGTPVSWLAMCALSSLSRSRRGSTDDAPCLSLLLPVGTIGAPASVESGFGEPIPASSDCSSRSSCSVVFRKRSRDSRRPLTRDSIDRSKSPARVCCLGMLSPP